MIPSPALQERTNQIKSTLFLCALESLKDYRGFQPRRKQVMG